MKLMKGLVAVVVGATLLGCGAYMQAMNTLPKVGMPFKATNTMSVSICKVTVFSRTDPKASNDNEDKYRVLMAPGAARDLYPPDIDADGGQPSAKLSLRVQGCVRQNTQEVPGPVLVTLDDVDTHLPVTIR